MLHAGGQALPMTSDNSVPTILNAIAPLPRTGSLSTLAYDQIKALIVADRLDPTLVHSASQFAERLQVSRTPVREALLQLAKEGFLTLIDGQGFRLRQPSRREVRDFFEARAVIETYVVRRLTTTLGEDDLLRLEQLVQAMARCAEAGVPEAFLQADQEFHRQLLGAYRNELMRSLMEDIEHRIPRFGQSAVSNPGRFQAVVAEHRAILEALRARDPERAAAAALEHLRRTEECVLAGSRRDAVGDP
jgi:DNA-binding GntR family transcriptional regulator